MTVAAFTVESIKIKTAQLIPADVLSAYAQLEFGSVEKAQAEDFSEVVKNKIINKIKI